MNKVLKMDFRGQTAVLSAFVLVAMMFLVAAITEKALASIVAIVRGTCGPEGQTHPCEFTFDNKVLVSGKWVVDPTPSGTSVGWETLGGTPPIPNDEKGYVYYWVGPLIHKSAPGRGGLPIGHEMARLDFHSPAYGSNTCDVVIVQGEGQLFGTCHAGSGIFATFTYTLRSTR